MNRDAAEALSVSVLGWLATDDERLMAFLGASGAGVEDLRIRAQDPDFLGFVLDFLLLDEAALVAFCDREGIAYDTPMRARAALPGGDLPHWT
ncbi:MAG: DUF3572 domain-containing protein [Pseudomonadota bacterium]